MKSAFKPVLSLEIWHDYFLGQLYELDTLPTEYDLSETIALIPTQECQIVLQNLRWLVRAQPQGSVLLAQIDHTAENFSSKTGLLTPIVPIDVNARLTFWLVIRDRNFANYTNLLLDLPSNAIYYFSNRSGSQVGDRLYLTQPLAPYQSGAEYRLGQLVSYTTPQSEMTLEAVQYQASASSVPQLIQELNSSSRKHTSGATHRAGEWMQLPRGQYVSSTDYLPRQDLVRSQTISSAKPGDQFQLSLVNLNNQSTFSHLVQVPNHHPVNTDFPVNLNFTGQLPGHYRLLLDGNPIDEFILFNSIVGRDAFALVEISLNPLAVPTAFQLLHPDPKAGHLQPKTYRIHFKNRATHWRYHCDRPHGFSPDHLLPKLQLIDSQTYTTTYPLGLYRKPRDLLTDGNHKPLPVPDISMIKPLVEAAPDGSRIITAVFSDTYL